MGQPAHSDIFVSFDTKENAQKAKILLDNYSDIIKTRWDGDGNLADLKVEDDGLSCQVYSDRVQNCEWQMRKIAVLLAESGGVIEFTADLYINGDGMYFCGDDDQTFAEYASDIDE